MTAVTHQTDPPSGSGEPTRRWGTASNRELKRARPGEAPIGSPGRFLFATIDELGEAALNLAAAENPGRRRSRRLATTVLARWLEQWPGQGWHDKWASSGSEDLLTSWWTVTELDRPRSRQAMTTLIALRAVRPSYAWMAAVELTSLTQKFQDINELDDFGLIHHAADQLGLHADARVAANTTLVRIMVATGKVMAEITKDDIFACTAATQDLGRRAPAHALWLLLRHAGFLAGEAPTLQAASALGRSSVEEMVDRHQPGCRPVRDVFVDYLKHRAAALDYPSLWATCYYLVSLFWSDLEKHQPGISSFAIEPEAVQAWKSRMQARMAHISYLKVLVMVRAFYLDVAEWALQEPERWGPWAAPCPVQAHELKGHSKIAHKATARMHARTRTLAPLLPALARSAREWMKETGDLLVPARAAGVGDEFVVNDRRYRRLGRQGRTGPKVVVLELFGENRRIDVSWAEDDAFWSWAVIEVLRLTECGGRSSLSSPILACANTSAGTGN